MQQPTCTDIRIRSTRDAHIIFHAVSLDMLPVVTRRLDSDERASLRSGNVYAWEERGPHTEVTGLGIERFTEGRRWGPSRVRDEFLFYYEKSPPDRIRDNGGGEQHRSNWDPMVKQTYSVWVDGPKGRRKWHLTAYFTQATVDRLRTVEDIPQLASLDVPHGKYISTRLGKPRTQSDTSARHPSIVGSDNRRALDVYRPGNSQSYRTYAPFPMPYQAPPPHSQALQHSPDVHQQYYPPSHPATYDYNAFQQGRPMPLDSQRSFYAPLPDRTAPNYASTEHQDYFRQEYGSTPFAQGRYAEYAYAYPASHAQLPTPTSPSDSRLVTAFPQYDHRPPPQSYTSGPHSIPYGPSRSYSQPSLHAPNVYGPSFSDRDYRALPSLSIPDSRSSATLPLPSPEGTKPEGYTSYNGSLTPPPIFGSRLSPPVSDARDEYHSPGESPSPPRTPQSAVSTSSVPGGKQVQLAPLRTLLRGHSHPYRRDKFDSSALSSFSSRKASE